jgi:hypothetical protein
MNRKSAFTLVAASSLVSLNALAGWSSQQLIQSVAPMVTNIGPVCQVVTTSGLRYAVKMDTFGQAFCDLAKTALLQTKYVQFMNPIMPSDQASCEKLTYTPQGEAAQTACIGYSIGIQR